MSPSVVVTALLLVCVAVPVHMIGLHMVGLIPTPTEKGVPSTQPPENALKTHQYAKTTFKDYYSKTQVIVTPVVSTVMFQLEEYATVLNETWLHATPDLQHVANVSIGYQPRRVSTIIIPDRKFDEFDWPTETQMYTTAVNATATVTTVVENNLPLV